MLISRFFKPTISSDIILREPLLDIIDQKALKPLLIFVAPGGFGKSIAVSQWIESRSKNFAWLSIDKDLDNFEIFLSTLTASLKNSGFDMRTEVLLLNTCKPSYEEILSSFVNDLDQFDEEFYIVLDDYHYLENNEIHAFIKEFLSYSRTNIHLLIISRTYPAFDISKFQAQLAVEEVSLQNLKFNARDFSKLIQNSKVKELSKSEFDKILDYTEGWAIGLILALNIHESEHSKNIIDRLNDKTSLSLNFFLGDLLEKQTIFIKKYLILTALLRRFSKGLLSFLISKNLIDEDHFTKTDFINHIRKNKLFVVTLDDKGEWFRYHHIFQKYLIDQVVFNLSNKEIFDFFELSSKWFSGQGLIEEAIEIALRKEDNYQLAIGVFNEYKNDIINKEQFNRLNRILKLFPGEAFAQNAMLISARVLLGDSKADYNAMNNDLKTLESLINSDDFTEGQNSKLRGEYYALLSCRNFLTGNVMEAQESGEQALLLLPSNYGYYLDFATAYTAMSYFVADSLEKSILFVDDILNKLSHNNIIRKTRLQSIKSLTYALDFKLNDLSNVSFQYYQHSYDQSLMMTWVMGSYFLGMTHYQSNKLKEVSSYLIPLIESKYYGRPFWNLFASFIYLKTQFFLGNFDDFKNHLNDLNQWVDYRNDQMLSQVLQAIKAEFLFFQQDIEEGKKHLMGIDFRSFPVAFFSYYPQTTGIKLNLSSKNKEDIVNVGQQIDVLISQAVTIKNRGLWVQTLALKAIYLEKLGDFEYAVKCLEESILLNNANYCLRVYLDLLPILKPAIILLKPGANKSKLQNDLIDIIRNSKDSKTQIEKKLSLDIVENELKALSKREVELMDLLSKGYTNYKISQELFISPSTVKKHFYRIYKKLGVSNRVNAILRARDLGIIEAN